MSKPLTQAPTLGQTASELTDYSQVKSTWTSDCTAEAQITCSAQGLGSEEGVPTTTITQLFQLACSKHGSKTALCVERPCPPLVKGSPPPPAMPMEDWTKWTWQEYYDQTSSAARGMIGLGLKRFDAVSIYGFNAPEWHMAELACIMAGGIAAGIYPSDTPEQVAYKARHSASSIAVVDNMKKVDAFRPNLDTLPHLRAIVVWAPEGELADIQIGDRTIKVMTWDELIGSAEGCPQEELQARIDSQKPGHAASYIYTSGTTGNPKAVMMSHDNLIFESSCVLELIPRVGKEGEEERILSYLPLSHVAGMMVDIIAPMVCSARHNGWINTFFARIYDLKVGTVKDRLCLVRPTMFLGVPRVWEKVAEAMKKVGAQTKGCKKKVSTFAKGKNLEKSRNMQMGMSGDAPSCFGVANAVMNKVRGAIGLDKCKFGFTGAAPISVETLEYYGQLGINVNEVYGMSECTGATTWSTDLAHVWGSCGWQMPGTEVKIFAIGNGQPGHKGPECPPVKDCHKIEASENACKGEICFRGRHIMMGYAANKGEGSDDGIALKNRETIDDDGWLHSGDEGVIDSRGMVKITGRFKELIIGAGGENIAPVPIEDEIKANCPAISNIMMIGDKQKFNVALVTLKAKGATGELPGGDELDGAALDVSTSVKTISGAIADESYWKTIEAAIIKVNSAGIAVANNASKIQKFCILPRDFSSDTEELTPTFKLKRGVVSAKHADLIDSIYAAKGSYFAFPLKGDEVSVANPVGDDA